MTFVAERLATLRRHLHHLDQLRPRISGPAALSADLSLSNDVRWSLFTVCRAVLDLAGDIAVSRGDRFASYEEAIASLGRDPRFTADLMTVVERLPALRHALIHESRTIDPAHIIEAIDGLEPLDDFAQIITTTEQPRNSAT